ncbi:MAG: GNAT family N-acetyltransferase [Deltaproteobacteria bacterium]|nr:GNAT family N-acetyltransferase [Deltaproteobacteria bacterium]
MGTSRAWDAPVFPFERVDLRDRELWLRPLLAADAFTLFRLIDAERVRLGQWLPWVEETRTERDSARFIADATEERRRRRSLVLAMCVEGAIVGTIGLHYVEWFDRSAELGYWITSAAEGRGIVTRAARALLTFAFGTVGLHRIVVRCAVGNERSARVAERLGMRREGLLREAHYVGGRFLDQHLYALLRHEHAADR